MIDLYHNTLKKRRSIAWLPLFLLLSGCVYDVPVSKVPGREWGGTYCISTRYSQAYHETVSSSEYSYGRYKNYSLGGNHGLCSLSEFHVLKAQWVTKSGVNRYESIDVKPLIEELRANHKVPLAYSAPDLYLEIVDRTIFLTYEIYDTSPGIEKSDRTKRYPLYSNTE